MSDHNIQLPSQTPASGDITPLELPDLLPQLLAVALQRRYLDGALNREWRIEPRPNDNARPLLREIVAMGRPEAPGAALRTMPHVLTACQDRGHSLVMVVQGQGERHRIYLGARRLHWVAGRSTEEYLAMQESAFAAYFRGLRMEAGEARRMDRIPAIQTFVETAPSLAVLTGIPSGRGGAIPGELQSLDRFVQAVGDARYLLMIVAEPLSMQCIDATLDACRRLKSEIHAGVRRTVNRTRSGGTSESRIDERGEPDMLNRLPSMLYALSMFGGLPGLRAVMGGVMLINSLNALNNESAARQTLGANTGWSESGGGELLDANAEACEALVDLHITRLEAARSLGWWNVAVSVAGENEAATASVCSALRSLCSGERSALDPIRTIVLPHERQYLVREAMERGQVLRLQPVQEERRHPLGEAFETLGACLHSDELALWINLPQQEIPGLPQREHGSFALTVTPPTADSIPLGTLLDGQGRSLSEVRLSRQALNRHIFITGTPGFGKTNTSMQILLEAYLELGVPFLVIEPAKTEYRRLIEIPQLQNVLRIYSVGGTSPTPLRLNPLQWAPGIGMERHLGMLKDVFKAAFPMHDALMYVLEDALRAIYLDRGWNPYDSSNLYLEALERPTLAERSAVMPCLQDLRNKIEVVMQEKGYGEQVHRDLSAALRSRVGNLLIGNKGAILNSRRSTPFEQIFEVPAVIELEEMSSDEERAFVMALIFALLGEYAQVRQSRQVDRTERLQHITLIEEAHRLLASPPARSAEQGNAQGQAVETFTNLLAELRARGEGFIIADQVPSKMAPDVLKNSALKIVHRLTSHQERQMVGYDMGMKPEQIAHINTLTTGEAIVHNEEIGSPALVRIHQIKGSRIADHAINLTPPGLRQEDRTYLYRHSGCEGCPSACDFYLRLTSNAAREGDTPHLTAVWESVLLEDEARAWRAWTQWRENEIRNRPANEAPALQQGALYCTAAQAAHRWAGSFVAQIDSSTASTGASSRPPQFWQDDVARVLAQLIATWLPRSVHETGWQTSFTRVSAQLGQILPQAPPSPYPGCARCPAPCRAYSLLRPHRQKYQQEVARKIINGQAPAARLEEIGGLLRQMVPLIADCSERAVTALLYCAITNCEIRPEGVPSREELLDHIGPLA